MFRKSGRKLLRRNRTRSVAKQPAVTLKSTREIQLMREAGRIVAKTHEALRAAIQPGISTWELDQVALEVFQRYHAKSCFLGYRGFPANICVSVNEELVHGIPNKKRRLMSGDIVSIDVGVRHRGFIGDSAWTYHVGTINDTAQKLMDVTEASLYAGIEQAIVGKKIVDISRAIQRYVEDNNFHIVREYTGHGVGREMHEPPQVLNYVGGDPDGDFVLKPGVVIAIEPMVQQSTWLTETLSDQWTVVSKDQSLAAHFEHTIAVTNSGPKILTQI